MADVIQAVSDGMKLTEQQAMGKAKIKYAYVKNLDPRDCQFFVRYLFLTPKWSKQINLSADS